MTSFRTEKRLEKIAEVLKFRQQSLHLVLENIHDPHNVSAIFRTCDAVGIPKVSLIYNQEKFPKIGKKSSASAFKWVDKEKFMSVSACFDLLRSDGFKIYASSISDDAIDFYKINFNKKIAIVFGNEHRGISENAARLADSRFKIPMFGMVQSLNVSVAAAIVLYEACRQRIKKGFYKQTELDKDALNKLIEKWIKK